MISWLFEKALQTGLTCPYIAPNRTQAKNIVWGDHVPRILDQFIKKGLKYKTNEVELSVELPRGKVQLLGVENKEALRGISNWGAVAGDEYDDWNEDIYPTIIRPNLITYKAPIILGGTPKGFRNLYRLEEGGQFKCFHFTSHDNPKLSKEELNSLIKEYQSMGMAYYRQEILAEYVKPVGTVYEEWNMEARYLPINYDPALPLHISFDWGINDPTAVIWIQPYQSEIRIIDYYEASDANIEHFISLIHSKPYKIADLYTGDPAGKARSLTTGTSVIEMLAKKGIYVRIKDGVKIPDQIRVTHSTIPRLYVDSQRCERFRNCILNYKYPTVSTNIKNQSNELPIHDEFSHAIRAYEYWVVNTQTILQSEDLKPLWGSGQHILDSLKSQKELERGDSYY